MQKRSLLTMVLAGILLVCGAPAYASIVTYTNQSDFLSALSGPHQTLGFESQAAGSVIPSGSTVGGITFTYAPFGGSFLLRVENTFQTTSPTNYLGTTGDGVFLAGDQFTMTFAQPTLAVGLFVIASGTVQAADFSLTAGGTTGYNSATTDSTFHTLSDTGQVFFVGLVQNDPNLGFSSAQFASLFGSGLPFNIDDITTASRPTTAPEPGILLLLGVGLVGMAGRALRKKLSFEMRC